MRPWRSSALLAFALRLVGIFRGYLTPGDDGVLPQLPVVPVDALERLLAALPFSFSSFSSLLVACRVLCLSLPARRPCACCARLRLGAAAAALLLRLRCACACCCSRCARSCALLLLLGLARVALLACCCCCCALAPLPAACACCCCALLLLLARGAAALLLLRPRAALRAACALLLLLLLAAALLAAAGAPGLLLRRAARAPALAAVAAAAAGRAPCLALLLLLLLALRAFLRLLLLLRLALRCALLALLLLLGALLRWRCCGLLLLALRALLRLLLLLRLALAARSLRLLLLLLRCALAWFALRAPVAARAARAAAPAAVAAPVLAAACCASRACCCCALPRVASAAAVRRLLRREPGRVAARRRGGALARRGVAHARRARPKSGRGDGCERCAWAARAGLHRRRSAARRPGRGALAAAAGAGAAMHVVARRQHRVGLRRGLRLADHVRRTGITACAHRPAARPSRRGRPRSCRARASSSCHSRRSCRVRPVAAHDDVHAVQYAGLAWIPRVVAVPRRQRIPADAARRPTTMATLKFEPPTHATSAGAHAGRATRSPGMPRPAVAHVHPAAVVEGRVAPRRVVDPGPAPGTHVVPVAVAVGRPVRGHAASGYQSVP